MKMTRSKLKGIVKECLVEILSEGIGSAENHTSLREASENKQRQKRMSLKKEEERLAKHRKSLDQKIENTVANLTTNSVMQDILADTARTTLQEQMKYDGRPGQGPSDDPGISLNNIFSESSQVWSDLAFADKKNT